MAKTNEIAKQVADKVIALMEEHGAEGWTKGWTSKMAEGLPFNIASNKNYNGINIMLLSLASLEKGYSSSAWGTFKQWQAKKSDELLQQELFKEYYPLLLSVLDEIQPLLQRGGPGFLLKYLRSLCGSACRQQTRLANTGRYSGSGIARPVRSCG